MNTNNYADFGKRFAALLLDSLILCIPCWMVFFLAPIWSVILAWLYFALMESSSKMATVGKQALGIIVTDLNGNRISFGKATGRYFGKIISCAILYIGFLMALWTDRHQALHDMMAGTLVLNGKANETYNNISPSSSYTSSSSGPILYSVAGEFAGKSFLIPSSGLTLGRSVGECQVIFSASTAGISRLHCSIYFNSSNGTFILTDIGSTYGTFHEKGMKLAQGQSISLNPGERFYLASRSNMFEVRI